jgi:uncharacterized protein
MIHSRESASPINPAEAALDAVKTYIRMNREQLSADGELLALLLPERVSGEVRDLQRFVIEKLAEENQTLKMEHRALIGMRDRNARISDSVRRAVLDLVATHSIAAAIAVALDAAPAFGADHAALCVETPSDAAIASNDGLRAIAPGTVDAMIGAAGVGAILSGGGELLLASDGADCRSVAAFRLRLGPFFPPALYVLGANKEGCFEGRDIEADLSFFAQALERAIRTWLDLPKV